MSKRPSSTKLRRECFETHRFQNPLTGRWMLKCHLCGEDFEPARTPDWEAEHVTRRVLSNDDSTSNVLPAHFDCHKVKTKADIKEHSHQRRVSDRHFNIKQSSRWNQRFRRKVNGETVER